MPERRHDFKPHPDSGLAGIVKTYYCTVCGISEEHTAADYPCDPRILELCNTMDQLENELDDTERRLWALAKEIRNE